MFKKRERPTATRPQDTAGSKASEAPAADAGEDLGGPAAAAAATASARKHRPAAGGNDGSGFIAASTRRNATDDAALREDRGADPTFAGFQARGSHSKRASEDAVRLLETETEVDKDTRAMHERNQKIHEGLKSGELEAGIYRGLKGYKQYAERSEGAISASKYSGLLGPTRGMSNVRTTMRIEFWASSSGTDGGICKDYKETGYCGFGDTCKFLHDRSDYKSGHLIEKEWEEKQKAIEERKRKQWEKKALKVAEAGGDEREGCNESGGSSSSDEGEIPGSCPICDSKWEDCSSIPVQTICGHYFCEDCAMGNYANSPKCATCGAATNGIFNCCDILEQRLKQKKAAAQLRKQAKRGPSDPFSVGLET